MSEALQLVTPVGRLVQGDCFRPSTTDASGDPLVNKDGSPRSEWFIGVAIPKGPEADEMWSKIQAKAKEAWPAGQWQTEGFSWKISDGDLKPDKEGFAGCYIVRCSSGFAPTVWDNQANPQQITDTNAVQRGYYVQVSLSVCGNGQTKVNSSPGMYVNLHMIALSGYGPVITSAPDPSVVFANRGALPPGASLTPVAASGSAPIYQAPTAPSRPDPLNPPPITGGPPVPGFPNVVR